MLRSSMKWSIIFFAFFTAINSKSIQIEKMRRDEAFELHRIREIFFELDESNILLNNNGEMNMMPVQINRSRIQETINNVLERITEIDEKLVDSIYSYIETFLNTYNRLTYEYLQFYYESLIETEDWWVKGIYVVLFHSLNPNEAMFKDSLFALLNVAEKDVKTIFDNLLVYAPRQFDYGNSTETLNHLIADIKRYKFYESFQDTIEFTNVLDDDVMNMDDTLYKVETKLNALLNVFSNFYVAHLLKPSFYKKSYSKINVLKMFVYDELKCSVKIRSSKNASELKIIEKWNCDPDSNARDYGFMSLSYGTQKQTLKTSFLIMDEESKKMSSQNKSANRQSLADLTETLRKENTRLNFIKESLGERLNEVMEDDKYQYEYYEMSFKNLDNWVIFYNSTSNFLTLKYIAVELMIFTAGLISSNLLLGAERILYKYCLKLENPEYTLKSVQNVRFLRTYLIVFHSLLKELKTISNHFTIIVTRNIYFKSMEENLSKMMDLISIDKYDGENDFFKIQKMRITLLAEYGEFHIEDAHIDDWNVKLDYILSPIILLSEAIDLLFIIQFQN